MMKSMRLLVVILVAVAGVVLMSHVAFAKSDNGNTRPGWGHGDKHHHHTGPPGQSVFPGDGDNDKDDKKHKKHHKPENVVFDDFGNFFSQFFHNG